jgi:hypothetical protein
MTSPLPKLKFHADFEACDCSDEYHIYHIDVNSQEKRELAIMKRLKEIYKMLPSHVDDEWNLRDTAKAIKELIAEIERTK